VPPLYRHRFPHPDTGEFFYDTTNSKGWKDVEHSIKKPPGAFRILFVGDSFTWGYVPLDALYTRQVEKLLMARGRTETEVISMGVGGWGTDQSLEVLSNEGVGYSPDLVIYQFCSNDVLDNLGHKVKPFRYELDGAGHLKRTEQDSRPEPSALSRRVKDVLLESALLYNLNRARLTLSGLSCQAAEESKVARLAHVATRHPNPLDPYFLYYQSPKEETRELREGWRLLEALVARMRDVAEAHGARFLVFSVSCCDAETDWHLYWKHFQRDGSRELVLWEGATYPADFKRPLRDLQDLCKRQHVPLIKPVRRYKRYLYDSHTDESGNRSMAEDIVDFLEGCQLCLR
jgi:hypothetical protein